jgi:putative methionine-R-sulfoxide reductase with GAF domain
MDLFENEIASRIKSLPSALQSVCQEVIAEIEQLASQPLSLVQFSDSVVEVIHRAFKLHSVNLYTVETRERRIVLTSGTGDTSRMAIQQGHKLPIDGNSLIGTVVQSGQGRVALDIDDQIEYPSPMLPPVHSKLAMPIISPQNNTVIGVLDAQSDEYETFGVEEGIAFSIVANYIALVLSGIKRGV